MLPAIFHWFRRDLRLHDNPALHAAHQASQGRVIPVFIQSNWRSSHPWSGPARQAILCASLAALAHSLETSGTRLIIRRGQAVAELERLFIETHAGALYYNRSPDPWGRALETRVEAMARRLGLEVHAFNETTALPPDAVRTASGEAFRVYTPFARAWMNHPLPPPLPTPGRFLAPAPLPSRPLPTLADWGLPAAPRQLDPAELGEPAALRRLGTFLSGPVYRYAAERDFPGIAATSRLSADLRWGCISIRLILRRCREALAAARRAPERLGPQKYFAELLWREFYMATLWRWPEVLELEFQPRFRGMHWQHSRENFERWSQAATGFPIVDAGMRQLASTDWMHNRLRMIVAMFLTKDLHLDWRLGEAFFMRTLADGETASNNGGWQWSAGTGADAAPYFRIQNPWLQSARFDPEGVYIKTWLPELRGVPTPRLHRPPEPGSRLAPGYPPPMVDHARERAKALEAYP